MAFLSHGDVKDKLATFDDYIYLSEIIDPIKRAKNLFQKPKIFIIQACRGTDFMNGVQLVAKRSRQCTWPVEADILCVFPTTEGHASWRNPSYGSWFIFDLMSQIKKHGKQIEFHHLLLW